MAIMSLAVFTAHFDVNAVIGPIFRKLSGRIEQETFANGDRKQLVGRPKEVTQFSLSFELILAARRKIRCIE
jgi:hypothetical protein